MRVVVGTGGTAGHVFPAVAVAERLRDRLQTEVVFVGRAEGPEARMVPAAGFHFESVRALPFARKVSLAALRAPFAALAAARRCRAVVRGADAVVGMGGYVSVPVALAARRERVPLVVHEQNAVPGLANRVAARWARAVALSFPEARARFPRRTRTVLTGNPVRFRILRVPEERSTLAREGREALGLEAGRRTVVAFGGSQGALRINRAVARLIGLLSTRADLQVVLIAGRPHHERMEGELGRAHGDLLVRVVPFVDRMDLVYAVADLVVCRAGATTVAELGVCGIPSVLVPYPHATGGHQEVNARAVERAGGAVVIGDGDLTGDVLADVVRGLMGDPDRLRAMSAGAASFGRPNAADAVADLALEVTGP